MSKRDILQSEILALSHSDIWEQAVEEWELLQIWRADEPQACLCTHFPIIEICEIGNRLTDVIVEVGNVCVKNFMGMPSEALFAGLRRIYEDSAASASFKLIEHCRARNILNSWEYRFYLDVMSKRKLSQRQLAKKRQINTKIRNVLSRGKQRKEITDSDL